VPGGGISRSSNVAFLVGEHYLLMLQCEHQLGLYVIVDVGRFTSLRRRRRPGRSAHPELPRHAGCRQLSHHQLELVLEMHPGLPVLGMDGDGPGRDSNPEGCGVEIIATGRRWRSALEAVILLGEPTDPGWTNAWELGPPA
jgi:hypothetical protein